MHSHHTKNIYTPFELAFNHPSSSAVTRVEIHITTARDHHHLGVAHTESHTNIQTHTQNTAIIKCDFRHARAMVCTAHEDENFAPRGRTPECVIQNGVQHVTLWVFMRLVSHTHRNANAPQKQKD